MNLAQCRTMVETDFRNFDGLTTVTYIALGDESGSIGSTTANLTALKTRDLDEQESRIAFAFPGRRTIVWHILKVDLDAAGVEPRPRDRIDDADGRSWITQRVQLQSWDARYRFMSVDLHDEVGQ